MFIGIVEGTLTVLSIGKNNTIEFSLPISVNDLNIGGSIAIDGVCLTVTQLLHSSFFVDLMPETLAITNLKSLKPGSQVNYERCIKLNSRIEGHIVKGHVDGTGIIKSIREEGNSKIITITSSPSIIAYIIPKASIAIDGMSITIIEVDKDNFTVGLIPHTVKSTIAHKYKPGDELNLEIDDMAKYMMRYMASKY